MAAQASAVEEARSGKTDGKGPLLPLGWAPTEGRTSAEGAQRMGTAMDKALGLSLSGRPMSGGREEAALGEEGRSLGDAALQAALPLRRRQLLLRDLRILICLLAKAWKS